MRKEQGVNKFSASRRHLLQLLSADDIEDIINDSLTVLEKVGVNIKNDEAMRLLEDSGCEVDSDRKIAKIPQHLVKECLSKTASIIRLYSRDGKHEYIVGRNNTIFNPGSSAIYFNDHKTGEIRQPFSKDLVDLVRLVDGLKYIQAQSTAMLPCEVPEKMGDIYRLYLVLKNSTKGVITGAFTKEGLFDMKRLLEVVAGGEGKLSKKPMAIFDVCPSSPLMWSDTTCQNLIDCARFHIPAEIIPAPQMGATSPITLAGTLVQFNAELLSGMVISQLTKPGAPVIYGGSPTTFDMKYLSSRLGSIENMMVACAASQIAKHLKLPTHAYLGLSDSKILDAQSGIETSFGVALGALAGINVVSGPGMLVFENCQSLEKLVIDNEICGMALRLVDGIAAGRDRFALEVISKVGPGGHYLAEKHTLKWFEKEYIVPSDVIDRLTLEAERKQGSKDIVIKAREAVDKILKEHVPEPLPIDVEKDLRNTLKGIMNRHKIKSLPIL
jgi:trimethylamine--corrinoid protein Co-methyltransferase